MSGFKLIGIRPHKDCGSQFLKLLEPGRLYQFCHEYEFYTKQGEFDGVNGELTGYSYEKIVPDDLYNIDDFNINISALVGKNGTGKSTLIELLLYSIYYLGSELGDVNGTKILDPYFRRLEEEETNLKNEVNRFRESNKKLDNFIKSCFLNPSKKTNFTNAKAPFRIKTMVEDLFYSHDQIVKLEKDRSAYSKIIKTSKEKNNKLLKEFKCSILYSLKGEVIRLNINTEEKKDTNIEFEILSDSSKKKTTRTARDLNLDSLLFPKSYELLSNFFYSIFLNYSHHSLNSNNLGDWVITLFHKNDGYKTPAVINPMRDSGNIYINNEINLSKNRLLTNLLVKRFVERQGSHGDEQIKTQVTEKQYVQYVSFHFDKLNHQKNQITLGNKKTGRKEDDFLIGGETNLITDILNVHYKLFHRYDSNDYLSRDYQYMEPLLDYLVYKIKRILKNYPEYYSPSKTKQKELIHAYKESIENLKNDKSHVTFKYHRVIHFLGKILDKKTAQWGKEGETIYFDLDELLDWMDIKGDTDLFEINRRLPPPIFDVDFIFENEEDDYELTEEAKKNKPKFSDLSSGEQQSIHSINSLIYHLNNAYSVHKKTDDVKRIKYNNFNVIFDEIELYFHPDLQRRFISELLNNLSSYKYLFNDNFVNGLNILFSTHSPFILSDIPKQNILQLEYGESEQTDDGQKYSIQVISKNQTFGANIHDLLANQFFLNDSIGEFAIKQIDELIYLYNKVSSKDLGKEVYLENLEFYRKRKFKFIFLINNIGDDVIREILRDHLDFIHEYFSDNEEN